MQSSNLFQPRTLDHNTMTVYDIDTSQTHSIRLSEKRASSSRSMISLLESSGTID